MCMCVCVCVCVCLCVCKRERERKRGGELAVTPTGILGLGIQHHTTTMLFGKSWIVHLDLSPYTDNLRLECSYQLHCSHHFSFLIINGLPPTPNNLHFECSYIPPALQSPFSFHLGCSYAQISKFYTPSGKKKNNKVMNE